MRYHLKPLRGKRSAMEKLEFILEKGEIFLEYPADGVGQGIGKIKMGDGVTKYKDLPYFINTSDSPIEIEELSTFEESYISSKIVEGETLKSILGVIKASLKHIINKFNNYVLKSSIIDNLTSTETTLPLSANQGRILNEKIDSKQDKLTNPLTTKDVVNNLYSFSSTSPLSANQGRILSDSIAKTANIGKVVSGGCRGKVKCLDGERQVITDCYLNLDAGIWLIRMEFGTGINPGMVQLYLTDDLGNDISSAGGSTNNHSLYKSRRTDHWETISDYQIVNIPVKTPAFYEPIYLCVSLDDLDQNYDNQRFDLFAVRLSI